MDTNSVSVVMETSAGEIRLELWPDKAPGTVANFLQYVDTKHYDGMIFHRVIDGFMIQGGGFGQDMQPKDGRKTIMNEARSDVSNKRGTLAMARQPPPHTARAQFFINLVDNGMLDHRDDTQAGFGYCVFGAVTSGMEVVDGIGKVKTGQKASMSDVPVETVVIKSVRRATP